MTESSDASPVLVTGGSGFLGGNCIMALLAQGYRVRTTVRSAAREAGVRAVLASGGADPAPVEFAVADLTSDAGWGEAVAGCRDVLHVASPFPARMPKREDDLIVPAREGTLRVLRAARDAGARRVVLTSSFAAVGYAPKDGVYTEADWTDPAGHVSTYVRSKTLAERAAWDFVTSEGGGLELAVVNPTAILGPVLGDQYATSVTLVKRMLDGAVPAAPKLAYGVVDVRDVADLHVRAMSQPKAAGQRYIAAAGKAMTILEIATVLRRELGAQARRCPTREMPDALVRLLALVVPDLRQLVPELGRIKQMSSKKARTELGWQPRSNEEAILATARSLLGDGQR
jgi:nucleoside-diphosphate-sugar epimerase